MNKHKAHMAVTAGLALGMLATIAAATPAIAETTDGNAVLSLAELTHTRIMADGTTR